MKIGIIGFGFVGQAIGWAHRHDDLVIRDPKRKDSAEITEFVGCDAIFVCVPTPSTDDGHCDSSILEQTLKELLFIVINNQLPVICKSTAPPSVYARLQKEYPNIVHCPEFLTAANAVQDYATGKFCYIGGLVGAYRNEAERLIGLGQKSLVQIIHCSIQEASLVKYTLNCFLATKVIFMNEVAKLAEANDCDWWTMQSMLSVDPRIGPTHLQVPGPDGKFGFGGMCFPKDTSAMLKFAEAAGQQMNVLEAAVKKNTLLRLDND